MTAAPENHPKHSYSPIRHNGLEVPETEIHLDHSPHAPNEPFRVYRTRGPECAPEQGLPALRTEWIRKRADTAE
ncbi:MAG: phosphomethylpyrimidine synthase ThiC, partial [Corynebacterium sp.]|nr:phosphomethylpyrimidine synthase ThiC [Corynebacterium sp.]